MGKMEGHCSTGQSSQWAVVPMEGEEEEEEYKFYVHYAVFGPTNCKINNKNYRLSLMSLLHVSTHHEVMYTNAYNKTG